MPSAGTLSLVAALAVLLGIALAVDRTARLGLGTDLLVVAARAVVQLFAVAVVIAVVFRTPALAPVYLAVMVTAAAVTSARRLGDLRATVPLAATAIVLGALAATVPVFVSRALPWDVRDVVPFSAQMIGGAMTATTLAALRFAEDTRSQWDVVEGWLALGARPAEAVQEVGRVAAGRALVPALDQTRNVGLVVLPGAFVGLLLGGATPLQAGRVQLLVLFGLLAAEAVAAVVVTRLLGPRLGAHKPRPPRS